MFDLTKEIELPAAMKKKYLLSQIVLFLIFAFGASYIFFSVFFPVKNLYFSFHSASAQKNTVILPRDELNQSSEKGIIKKNSLLRFDAPMEGNFSKADIFFYLENNSSSIEKGVLSVRKSFQSFFYPEEKPASFKEGNLVEYSGDYFIISGGKFRKFSFAELPRAMGYNIDSFWKITTEEIMLNEAGETIEFSSKYPNGTLFKINDEYYQVAGNILYKFISEKAFLTKYNPSQTIEKNEDFLNNFTIAEDFLGFADGALVSYGASVYAVNQGKVFPFADALTFQSMGYSWNDVIAIGADEIGFYKKGALLTISSRHPDGTIFFDEQTKKYFSVQNGAKNELAGPNIQKSYLRHSPVLASENGAKIKNDCQLKKKFGFSEKYACRIEIGNMQNLPGNDYQFELAVENESAIKEIKITFKQNINMGNLRLTLSDIKNKILLRYGTQK